MSPSNRSVPRSLAWACAAIAWMAAIFWVSGGPVPPFAPDQGLDVLVKKAGHFSAYALLAALWWLALRDRLAGRRAEVAAVAIAVAYAVLDEVHQALTPTRNPSPLDVAIDALGAVAGVWLVVRLAALRSRGPA